jgi:SEC-C motif
MIDPLQHPRAVALFASLKPHMKNVLSEINELRFQGCQDTLEQIRGELRSARSTGADAEDEYLNDIFVLDAYADLLSAYADLWKTIAEEKFGESWNFLQDALSLLRVIKRFSDIDVSFFEHQLLELERTYPYGVFASVGMLVDCVDCSICGLDIDSDGCPHRRGQLYRGVMAYGIVRNIIWADHVALTIRPADKRCVVQYPDDGKQFKLVRLLSQLINSADYRPSGFSHLQYSTRLIPNHAPRHLGRNDPCFCGSGKKLKRCCLSRAHVEQQHIDIIAVPRPIEEALV